MKVFWAILAVLVVAGAAVVFGERLLSPTFSSVAEVEVGTPVSGRPAHGGAAYDESAFFDGTEGVLPGASSAAAAPAKGVEKNPVVPAVVATPTKTGDVRAPGSDPVAPKSAAKPVTGEESKKDIVQKSAPAPVNAAPVPAKSTVGPSSTKAPEGSGTSSVQGAPASGSAPDLVAGDAKIEKQSDGSYIVDGKYTLKGAGTKASPFEITWDYLVSAQDSYQPRLGKKKLPDRLTVLSGKWVKITGNVAFPVMAQEPTEMLVMLNQWDGCCIGVPPTPYDAVEVKLAHAAEGKDRLVTYGSVTGKMTVEPYLVKDWLVSLYAMDDAAVTRAE